MNPEIKELWVNALLSGDYIQGVGHLKRQADGVVKHCCLGVLCELAESAGVVTSKAINLELMSVVSTSFHSIDPDLRDDGSTGILPRSVMRWAGMETREGVFDSEVSGSVRDSLTSMNDCGSSFEEIAKVIEKYF